MIRFLFLFLAMACLGKIQAQIITHEDGSALITNYCYEDTSYALIGTPGGGTFTGCGIYQQNSQWYFNPVTATQGITVFPYQCSISYTTTSNQTINRTILIQKPVRINPPLEDIATCDGNFTLEATTLYAGAYDYTWIPPAPLERPDTSVTNGHINQTTTFVLTATDHMGGCTGSDTVTVTKNPIPDVQVQPQHVTIMARDSVQLQATGATIYFWTPAKWLSSDTIPNPVAKPWTPITYRVTGVNEYGCIDSAEMTIDIKEQMLVPNAFSPNGDGLNDVFRIENIGYQGVAVFQVLNRWGKIVFQTMDATKGWDGTYNGQLADAGTYFYLIRLNMLDGNIKEWKGDLLLVR